MEETRKRREEEKKQRALEREDEKILRMDKKVTGVMLDTALTDKPGEKSKVRDDLHEINLTGGGNSGAGSGFKADRFWS